MGNFRSLQGFKEWACEHDIPGGVGTDAFPDDVRFPRRTFCENARGDILAVAFDQTSGAIVDAHLHREHVTHSLGSNTMSTLLRLTLEGNTKKMLDTYRQRG